MVAAGLLPYDWQCPCRVKQVLLEPFKIVNFLCESKTRVAVEELAYQNADFKPSKVLPGALVHTVAKRNMRYGLASEIEFRMVAHQYRIPVGRQE